MSTYCRFAGILAAVLIGGGLLVSGPAAAKEKVLAAGEKLEVTKTLVRNLNKLLEKRGLRTKSDELLKGAVRMRLFAAEAKEQGLVDEVPQGSSEQDLKDLMRIQSQYLQNELKKVPVDDKVVQSYYRSYPRRFVQESNKLSENQENATGKTHTTASIPDPPWTVKDLRQLDDKQIEKVRSIVRQSQHKQLSERLFQELETKYDVEYFTK